MEVAYDAAKDLVNQEKHGCSLKLAESMEWEAAMIAVDDRKAYGELRYGALGYIGHRIYYAVFTVRDEKIRMISLRKANKREVKKYAQT